MHVLFQTTEEKTYCNLQMWETREGLFILPTSKITNPQLHYLSGILTTIDQKALTDLQLSDSDYYELKNIKMIERINKRVCKLFRTDLELFRLTKSKFLKLKDDNNNQLILFSSNNAIFVPTCVDIETFFTKDKTIFCYKDIAVSFYLNDKEINGFLTEDLVLEFPSLALENLLFLEAPKLEHPKTKAKSKLLLKWSKWTLTAQRPRANTTSAWRASAKLKPRCLTKSSEL